MLPAEQIAFETPPEWVIDQPFSLPEKIPENEISNGFYHLLVDNQFHLAGGRADAYHHIVKKILDEKGVASASQIYISFNPAFEHLSIHAADIHRDGRVMNGLSISRIKLFQREQNLERRMYNGRVTAVVILEGTLPGDIIEYSYTVEGRNPVFGDHYVQDKFLAWDVPLHRIHYRFHFESRQPVHLKYHNLPWSPEVRKKGREAIYVFERKNVKAILSDGDLPSWYYPYPWIQTSQFADWQAVNRWAIELYRLADTVSPELQQAVRTLDKPGASIQEKITSALCLVQNDIRYLGIEMGINSHKPTDPSVTFKRKFGDCKDKTILFCTILAKLGIQAQPALVNTRWGKNLEASLPTPLAFNHIIARVVADGKIYWLDPTGDCQRTALVDHYQAHFGHALVVDGQTDQLVDMGVPVLAEPAKQIQETFDLTGGIGQTVNFHVRSVQRGRQADAIRDQIQAAGRRQTAKSFLNFYAADYPCIQASRPMRIIDDPEKNTVTIDEYYEIPDFWKTTTGRRQHFAVFKPSELKSWFNKPATTLRTMPLGIVHPQHIQQETLVKLPRQWKIAPVRFQESNAAFTFDYGIDSADRELKLTYRYQTHTDAVAASETDDYFAAIARVNNALGYVLYARDEEQSMAVFNWTGLVCLGIGLLVALGSAFFMYRYDPPPRRRASNPSGGRCDLTGIGGWLMLLMVFLVVEPVFMAGAVLDWLPYLDLRIWQTAAFTASPARAFMGHTMIGAEAMISIVYLVLSVLLLWLFFRKRSSFPRMFIVIQISYLLFLLGDSVVGKALLSQATVADIDIVWRLLPPTLQTFIWTAYLMVSARAKNTFLNRRRPPEENTAGRVHDNWPNQYGLGLAQH